MLATVGTALAGGFAGCGAYPPTRKPELQVQLEDVREATAVYAHPRDAMADGFRAFGPYMRGFGWHFRHPGRSETAALDGFDLERPNRLTYHETDDGFALGAVEWAAPTESVPANPDLFDDTDGSEEWHVDRGGTHVFALPDGQQTDPRVVAFTELVTNDNWAAFQPPDFELRAGDTIALNWGSLAAKSGYRTDRVVDEVVSHPRLNVLHAWVHTENPEGVFHPTNPSVE